METLLQDIAKCQLCLEHLEDGVNPVVSADPMSKIVIIGQAPGSIVHRTSKPWDDKSGERLRNWLGVEDSSFYNVEHFAIIPMGFCYPGKGKSGDKPPRKECAPQWHNPLLAMMPHAELFLLIGSYAQNYYLKNKRKTLTETVEHFEEYLPKYFPLPHPSPRNNIWLKKNQWFEQECLQILKDRISQILSS